MISFAVRRQSTRNARAFNPLGALLLLALPCIGCDRPLTQVVVLVGGDDAVTSLDIAVYDAAGLARSSARRIDLRQRAPRRLPTSFTLLPSADGDSSRFRIVVQGVAEDASGGARQLARREVIAAFLPEHTTLLPIVLAAACADERCSCSGPACERTCTPDPGGGRVCEPIPSHASLPDVVPGRELEQLATGLPPCAPGEVPSAAGGCEDLDECAFYLDACNTVPRACVNAPAEHARYFCACPSGYSGVGDIDDPCRACDGGPCE